MAPPSRQAPQACGRARRAAPCREPTGSQHSAGELRQRGPGRGPRRDRPV